MKLFTRRRDCSVGCECSLGHTHNQLRRAQEYSRRHAQSTTPYTGVFRKPTQSVTPYTRVVPRLGFSKGTTTSYLHRVHVISHRRIHPGANSSGTSSCACMCACDGGRICSVWSPAKNGLAGRSDVASVSVGSGSCAGEAVLCAPVATEFCATANGPLRVWCSRSVMTHRASPVATKSSTKLLNPQHV